MDNEIRQARQELAKHTQPNERLVVDGVEHTSLYVILTINADMASSEDEDEPFQTWKGKVYERVEDTERDIAMLRDGYPELSYQVGRVIPLEGDPEF